MTWDWVKIFNPVLDASRTHSTCLARVSDATCICSGRIQHTFWTHRAHLLDASSTRYGHVPHLAKRALQLRKSCCSFIARFAFTWMHIVYITDTSCMHSRCILHVFQTRANLRAQLYCMYTEC